MRTEKCLILCENSRVYDDPLFDKGNKVLSLDYNFVIIPKIKNLLSNNKELKVIGMDYESLKILKKAKIPHESFENYIQMSTNEASDIAMHILRKNDILKNEIVFGDSLFYKGIFLWDLVELYLHENSKDFIFYLELIKSIFEKETPNSIIITDTESIYGNITLSLAKKNGIDYSTFNYTPFLYLKNLFMRNFKVHFRKLVENIRDYNNFKSAEKVSLDYKNRDNNLEKKDYNVLILSDELRHIPQIIPWIKKIDKKNIGLTIISKNPWPLKFNELNINFKTFSQYENKSSKSAGKKAKERINNWRNLKEDIIKKFMIYNGMSTFNLQKNNMSNVFELYFTKIIEIIEITKTIIKCENPDLVIVMDERSWPGKTVVRVCETEDIPTLVLQHGIHGYLPIYGETYAKKFSVYGKFTKEILTMAGVSPEKIMITGGQQWDKIINYKGISKKEFCKEYGLDENKGIILYAGHLIFDREISEREVSGVIESVKKFPELQLIIRAHPSESLSLYTSLTKNLDAEDVLVFKKPHDFDSVNVCDILITQASTVAMDAIIAGKPVITVNFGHGDDPYPYAAEGVVIGVYKNEDIIPAIEKLLNDSNILQELEYKRKEFIFKHLYKIDGKSKERIVELITEMLLENKK
jgi:UDP-N-acetylglucosamine 2-epimerase